MYFRQYTECNLSWWIYKKWLKLKDFWIFFEILGAMFCFLSDQVSTSDVHKKGLSMRQYEKHPTISKTAVSWSMRQDICIPKECIPAAKWGLHSNLCHIVIYIPSGVLTKTAKMSSSKEINRFFFFWKRCCCSLLFDLRFLCQNKNVFWLADLHQIPPLESHFCT